MSYSYDRTASADEGGEEEFIQELKSHLSLGDRRIGISVRPLSYGKKHGAIYVNFINLPQGIVGGGGGAEAENNRMSFWIRGFNEDDPHAPSPAGKVKVEMANSALPRQYSLRAKTGRPSQIARYLAGFLNLVVKEVEPNFTHTGR